MILISSLVAVLAGMMYVLLGVLAGVILKEYGANKSVRFVAVILWPVVALTAAIWGLIYLVAFIFEE